MRWNLLFILIALCLPLKALACLGKTELEKTYCKIKQTPHGASLPNFFEFRKNSHSTQRLLLKRPAKKAGIALPAASPQNMANQNARKPTTTTKPPIAQNVRAEQAKILSPSAVNTVTPSQGISRCSLKGEYLLCPKTKPYRLSNNLSKNLLSKEALSASNQLSLPERHHYTVESVGQDYQMYIDKMLQIGLGGSTMSFSKFFYTHQEVRNQGQDHRARFKQMYEFLKQDRRTMAIKRRYDDKLPKSIDQCQMLGQRLVVCDDGPRNWIYIKT